MWMRFTCLINREFSCLLLQKVATEVCLASPNVQLGCHRGEYLRKIYFKFPRWTAYLMPPFVLSIVFLFQQDFSKEVSNSFHHIRVYSNSFSISFHIYLCYTFTAQWPSCTKSELWINIWVILKAFSLKF